MDSYYFCARAPKGARLALEVAIASTLIDFTVTMEPAPFLWRPLAGAVSAAALGHAQVFRGALHRFCFRPPQLAFIRGPACSWVELGETVAIG